MPTTSNFGWTTPADTDLVKDGAAAIRTLGNGIDTSLVDLKGGTTGQVLSKASNTDLDFSWVAQDDSNAIQNALLTTTGDTIYASAASTPARLGIGTAGQVLTVNSGATAPEWATPVSGGMTSIASGSLPTGSATLSLTSISGAYNDLQLVILNAGSNSAGTVYFTVNSDTGSNYGGHYVLGTLTQVTSAANATTGLTMGTANNGFSIMAEFKNYANTTSRKIFNIAAFKSSNASSKMSGWFGWDSTSAITSIQFVNTGNFTGGTYILYGVK